MAGSSRRWPAASSGLEKVKPVTVDALAAEARFPHGSAGVEAVADVPRTTPTTRAEELRAALPVRAFTSATEVAVLDGERFVGLVPIERVLAAPDEALLGELADVPVLALPEAELEAATREAARTRGRCIAVVDRGGRFHGLVPPDRLLLVLELEHEEDLARLGGFLSGASEARMASEEPVPRRLWHRLPWLVLGLLGAMASALVVGAFEEELRKQVLLAFFVPAVVYMADAVGTQTETVVIRGMALGVSIRTVLARELATGLVIGALLGSLFFPFALAAWGDARVAAAVAISLAISCSVATLVAMALPYALARLGRDPAFGSGPLATVIQDLLSIVAYFAVAVALVT
jgi:magnesium transporter